MKAAPRVLIADDHPPTRMGVRMALEQDGIEVCAEVSTAGDAVEAAVREHPDVCLLDVNMPGGGSSAASQITIRLPGVIVLMLTVSKDSEDMIESLRRGADGYLLKDMDPRKLAVAIRGALAGEVAVPRALAARLLEELRHDPHPGRAALRDHPGPELTRREWDVLDLLCDGASTAEIAGRLFVEQVTVRRHVSAILHKLGATSREEAVRMVRNSSRV